LIKVNPTGVFIIDACDLKLTGCLAMEPAPITVVKQWPSGLQIKVCSSCLKTMLNQQEWQVIGAALEPTYDFVAFSENRSPALVLEAKRLPGNGNVDETHWANSFLGNLLAHGRMGKDCIFILSVLDAHTFFWRLGSRAGRQTLLVEIPTDQAFLDLGLEPPSPGVDERFVGDRYRSFLDSLIRNDATGAPDWLTDLHLENLISGPLSVQSEVQLAAS